MYDEDFKVTGYAEPVFGFEISPEEGVTLKVHRKELCKGRHCVIHNPSDHPLKDAPMVWRADKGVMERKCSHGIGHDDPDDVAYQRSMEPNESLHRYIGVHGCDGCC